jgi:diacylglycerol kinase (ATP)
MSVAAHMVSEFRRSADAVVLVANPNASGLVRRAGLLDEARTALRRAGATVETMVTDAPDDVLQASGAGRLVVLGGDGSLHALANAAAVGDVPPISLLPAGRANNIARSLGIPLDLERAAQLAVGGRARPLDGIVAEDADGRYVALEGISVGYLARARVRYRGRNSADLTAGLVAGARELARFEPVELEVVTDSEARRLTVAQLFVANLPFYAFGLRVAPQADPRDGLADVVAVAAERRAALLGMAARVRRGSHVAHPLVTTWRAARLRIDARGRSPVVADSHALTAGPVELRVEPGVIEVVAP